MDEPSQLRLRVEKGVPSHEELAALTAVLTARAGALLHAAPSSPSAAGRPGAPWRRLDRMSVFFNPRTWR
ncbi:acyl-CoA carboxylase subunit epsilon [Streptomyces sp. NPDC039022]|uniref:acyl-CoA carboxylase subunit epsilon n=1 Tax=unclassified Streptomyces TaxID=2593676 RepID=UPI0033CF30EB